MKNRIIPAGMILIFLQVVAFGQTSIPAGEVYGTWDLERSPFHVNGDVTIPDDSTLVIEPGVRVEFQGHYSLYVQGRLLAEGNESDSIRFTVSDTTGLSDQGTSQGGWNGIRFIDTPLTNDSSRIRYCCFEYGKAIESVWHLYAGGAICIIRFGKVEISNCLFRNNQAIDTNGNFSIGGALYFFESDILLRENTFIHNRADGGGAIYFDDSEPVFLHNIIRENEAFDGGGIAMGGECHPSFSGDSLINNRAENNGGGLIFCEPSVVLCEDVVVMGNRARWGAGVGVQGAGLQAGYCLFSGNHAETWGGGVAGDFATLELNDCIFEQDSSEWGSGGLHMDHATATITNCSFIDNRAVFGGGFHAVYSQVTSSQNEFLHNQADGGGGVHLEDSDCTIDLCHFEGNQALNGSGGAIGCTIDTTIFERSNRFTLSRSNLTGNQAVLNCGAVLIEQLPTDSSLIDVVVDSCQFTVNHADVFGALRIRGSIEDFSVSRSVFQSNTANLRVGGAGFQASAMGMVTNCIFNSNYSEVTDSTKTANGVSLGNEASVTFLNCTFVDTSSANGMGLSLRRGSSVEVLNSIFWGCGDHPINIVTANDLGSTAYINFCDIENGTDSIYVSDSLSTLNWGDENIYDDPQFTDLMAGDLHLLDSSPCIGSGVNTLFLNDAWITAPVSDIAGTQRPSPGDSDVDMGAYESLLSEPVNTGIDRFEGLDEPVLYQNYPNPFSYTTTFAYNLSRSGRVRLSVYNLSGQEVAVLVSEEQQAGFHGLEWDGSLLSAGPYIYMLRTEHGITRSKGFVLLK